MRIVYNHKKDSIEFILKDIEGTVRTTDSPLIIERVDTDKNIVAISVLGVSGLHQKGSDVELLNIPQPAWTDFKLWYEMKN